LLEEEKLDFDLKSFPNHTPYVLQIQRKVDEEVGLVDFYFYDTVADSDYIREKWNFSGQYNNRLSTLKIQKVLIFPTKYIDFRGISVSVPAKAEETCRYLYGKTWKQRLEKNTQYQIKIVNHRPHVFIGKKGVIKKIIVKLLGALRILKVG
jgi:hypothetical protein